MKKKALELFCAVPRQCNCAQAVAFAAGKADVAMQMQSCGGGNAPGNLCGALYAAVCIAGAAGGERIKEKFLVRHGSVCCRELKTQLNIPCSVCVETAAELLEEEIKE